MAFLWICPMVLSHKANHIGDGTCGYKPADDCDVIFVVNGQTMDATKHGSNHGVYVDLTKVSAGSIAQINVKPKGTLANLYWEVAGQVKIGQPCVVTSNPNAAFCVATLAMDTQTASVLYVFLSRLQDCTEKVTYLLQTLPTVRPEDLAARATWSILWQNPLPSRGSVHYVSTTRAFETSLNFVRDDVTPGGDNLVFEVCGKDTHGPFVPKMLSVYWPEWLSCQLATTQPTSSTWPISEPTPFFIYYPASTGQNQTYGYYLGSYPESFDYLFYLFWCNHNYTTSLSGLKGIPYQIAHARTHVVSIVPCLYAKADETGHYNNADFLVECLEEIQAMVFRKKGLFICQPAVGRVALGGFSAGTQLVSNTWWKIAKHPFGVSKLMELYMFDPSEDNVGTLADRVATTEAFVSAGGQDKMGRVYTQIGSVAGRTRLQQYLGSGAPNLAGPAPSVRIADSADANKTAAITPAASWPALDPTGNAVPIGRDANDTHQLIPAMMLADALMRSGFKKEP